MSWGCFVEKGGKGVYFGFPPFGGAIVAIFCQLLAHIMLGVVLPTFWRSRNLWLFGLYELFLNLLKLDQSRLKLTKTA